jgi:hypothetical protein
MISIVCLPTPARYCVGLLVFARKLVVQKSFAK